MADDARTEARLRLMQALVDHRLDGARCRCGSTAIRDGDHTLHQADALLALFPEVEFQPLLCSGPDAMASYILPLAQHETGSHRQLILRGSVEPVVPEEPQP